ncbi:methionyl-tRNA formyltransferase [bacterium]|nr:methionyl-tRNA formyltransferase [bacterium]
MRVLFWGSPDFAVPSLEALAGSEQTVAGVVCQPDRPQGRGLKSAACAVRQAAERLGLPCLQPERPRGDDFLARLRELAPDISVVVAYGHILRPEVLALPPHGSINLHGSILPAWRGAAPIQRAVAAGEVRTGLTVIRMDAGMDTGPMLATLETEIGPAESAGALAERLSRLGGPLLLDTLRQIERGEVTETPQPAEGVSYASKIEPAQARIDWSLPAVRLACHVRAFDPFPGAFCLRGGQPLKLFCPVVSGDCAGAAPGTVTDVSGGALAVCCGDRTALAFGEVQAPGKRRMPAADWLRGARVAPGEKLG